VVAEHFQHNPPETDGVHHYAMVGYALDHTLSDHGDVTRGICSLDDRGLLTGVEEIVKLETESDGVIRGDTLTGERRELPPNAIVSMNFWAFTPAFFKQAEEQFSGFLEKHGQEPKSEFYIPTVVDELIEKGTADCRVLQTTANWFGVTYPDDKPHVVASIAKLVELGEYPSPLV
jgi:hypothetical protein